MTLDQPVIRSTEADAFNQLWSNQVVPLLELVTLQQPTSSRPIDWSKHKPLVKQLDKAHKKLPLLRQSAATTTSPCCNVSSTGTPVAVYQACLYLHQYLTTTHLPAVTHPTFHTDYQPIMQSTTQLPANICQLILAYNHADLCLQAFINHHKTYQTLRQSMVSLLIAMKVASSKITDFQQHSLNMYNQLVLRPAAPIVAQSLIDMFVEGSVKSDDTRKAAEVPPSSAAVVPGRASHGPPSSRTTDTSRFDLFMPLLARSVTNDEQHATSLLKDHTHRKAIEQVIAVYVDTYLQTDNHVSTAALTRHWKAVADLPQSPSFTSWPPQAPLGDQQHLTDATAAYNLLMLRSHCQIVKYREQKRRMQLEEEQLRDAQYPTFCGLPTSAFWHCLPVHPSARGIQIRWQT